MEQLDQLRDIADSIELSVKECFAAGGEGREIKIGADGYPTKMIDKMAEKAALDRIDELGLEWNIHSEEIGDIDRGKRYTLILDPVDGTYNAISGIPFFSTSLALLDAESESVTVGLVRNLPTGRTYSAVQGKGAFLDGKIIQTRKMRLKRAVVSSYIGPEAKGWVEELIFWPKRTRNLGCISLEICLVASGGLDMFVMFGRIPRLTDVAASHVILEEAGGRILMLDDKGRAVSFHPDFEKKGIKAFFALGDPTSLKRVLEISKVKHNLREK